MNIIRLTTWRHGDVISVMAPCVRFGIKGSATDVSYVDGVEIINVIGIHNGEVDEGYVTLEGKYTQIELESRRIPRWEEIVESVKNGAKSLPYFDIIGWDITVDRNGEVICIEYNLKCPGTIVYQFVHGPMASDETDNYLSFLRETNNQKKYLPSCISAKR